MKKITLLLAIWVTAFCNAQWTTDTTVNTLVADSNSDDAKAMGTSDGSTYIVFWKVVAAPQNYELRVQYLDQSGNRTLGDDGALISNTIPMSTSTVTWKLSIDQSDNLYVAVTGTGSGTPAIIFKINTFGDNLWGAAGVTVGAGYVPTVLPLSNGDVMVSYMPTSGKAKLQRYTGAGVPIWGAATEVIGGNASANTVPADMFELSDGGITMVFHQRFSFGVSSNLYAQRYNAAGVAQWAAPAQLSDKATAYNATYSGAHDGDVVFYGYTGSTGTRFDGFLQRIDADGTTPWGMNGADFDTNQTFYEMDTKIASKLGTAVVWAIARYTPSTQDLYGEFVQKFDKLTGARLFGENAKQVFPVDNNYRNHAGDLHLAGNRPLFLVKQGLDNGASPVTLGAVLLDSNGNAQFSPEILPVATFAASKGRVALTKPWSGQAVAVFTEQKSAGQNKIYAQRFADAALAVADHVRTDQALTIYPVPSSGQVNFKVDPANIGAEATVYTVSGHLVRKFQITTETFAANFPPGFYIVRLSNSGFDVVRKFIVTGF